MHGLIFSELKKYVETRLGPDQWSSLLLDAALPADRLYISSRGYSDEELGQLVAAAVEKTGLRPEAILEDFGSFIAPDLLDTFRSLVPAEWRTLDVLEQTEKTIHKVVRLQMADATPPYLVARRVSPTHVTIHYTSPRRLCPLAVGIVRGVAGIYGDEVAVSQPLCMLKGAEECRIEVELTRNGNGSSQR